MDLLRYDVGLDVYVFGAEILGFYVFMNLLFFKYSTAWEVTESTWVFLVSFCFLSFEEINLKRVLFNKDSVFGTKFNCRRFQRELRVIYYLNLNPSSIVTMIWDFGPEICF